MSTQLVPQFTYVDMESMAVTLSKTGIFGISDKNVMLSLMLISQAEGLHPAIAARDYHIIQGRPSLTADAMLARYMQAGGRVNWTEYTDERVTGEFSHPSSGTVAISWTIDMAKQAGVYKQGSGWTKYPRAMLRSRCVSEGTRASFPGCVASTYTPEEVENFEPIKRSRKDVTPEPESVYELATQEQVDELSLLIVETATPIETVDKWLIKACVNDISKMNTYVIQKCIDALKNKVGD